MSEERTVKLVLSTVSTEEQARKLARLWVESGRAACVTRIPGGRSCYAWKGKTEDEPEVLLLVKTAWAGKEEERRLLESFSRDHPYEEPELLVFEADGGAPGYLAWVLENTKEK